MLEIKLDSKPIRIGSSDHRSVQGNILKYISDTTQIHYISI